MELTKHGHACVVLSDGDRRLVIDPGAFTDPSVLQGASAVLVTHEHVDHVVPDQLKAALEADPALEVWTNSSVADLLDGAGSRVHVVGAGDTFTAAGFGVHVHGELHAVIHPDIPRVTNVGYLVDGGKVFHPGDALTVPDHPVRTLMLPVMAPWNKISEVIDYVREVRPERAYDIHDALLTDLARPIYDRQIGALGGAEHLRLAPGATAEL